MSLYLLWLKRDELCTDTPSVKWSLLFGALGAGFILASFLLPLSGTSLAREDTLFLTTASFIHCVLAGLAFWLGAAFLRTACFPLTLLYLLAPMPLLVSDAIAIGLQHASAEVSHLLIKLSGTAVYRDGLILYLPGLVIEVAKECSGIRSSYVLFITSLLTGYLFLNSMRMRVLLALLVVPIGILRNGLRILLISWLTLHVDPGIIHGPLHRRGGPIFFALSLGVLFVILLLLRKREKNISEKRIK
jgi:exosortase